MNTEPRAKTCEQREGEAREHGFGVHLNLRSYFRQIQLQLAICGENSPKNGFRLLINVKSWFSLECRCLIAGEYPGMWIYEHFWWVVSKTDAVLKVSTATIFLCSCESKSIFHDSRRKKKGAFVVATLEQIESSWSSNLFRKRRKKLLALIPSATPSLEIEFFSSLWAEIQI